MLSWLLSVLGSVGVVVLAVAGAIVVWLLIEDRRDRKRRDADLAALRARDWASVDRQMGLAPPVNPLEPTYTIADGGRDGHD